VYYLDVASATRICLAIGCVAVLAGGAETRETAAATALPEAARAAAALPRLHSLIVSQRGRTVFEHYAPGQGASRLANIKSASKSLISTLVGIAIERRLIAGLDEPLVTYFPELARDPDTRKRRITIEDMLTMRSGLESTSGERYGALVGSRNWVRHVLTRPLVSEPGTSMEYSTGTSHVLSALLTKVTGSSTRAFAQETLGDPLGIRFAAWPRDPQGIYFGGNEMLMTPRQMLAVGELYLNRGLVRGRRVVPGAWVDESCTPRTVSRWDPGREYGYGWWIDEIGERRACFAWGFGGQYIFVVRDLEVVIVATSSTAASDERWNYRSQLLDLIERHVLQPLEGGATR
jgi:CubicO group peptidase (beta-lactamase class C family)